jgi:hypothetical protein
MTSKWLALALETVENEGEVTPSPVVVSPPPTVISAICANRSGTDDKPLIENEFDDAPFGTIENANCADRPDFAPIDGHPAFIAACEAAIRNGPLPDMPERRWRSFLVDGPRLCADWSSTAHALGWQPQDFYGHNSAAPWHRLDEIGLAWLLDGQFVIAMDGRQARLTHLTFYRSTGA